MESEKFKDLISEAKKFADLNIRPLSTEPLFYEIISNKMTYFPAESPDCPISPIRCIVNPQGTLRVFIVGQRFQELNWFENKTEAMKLVRSLSWYGLRHKFCPGLTEADISQMVFGVSTTPPSHLVNCFAYPYQHYRSKDCLMYYPRPRGTKIEDAVSRCVKCSKIYYNKRFQKKKLGANPEEELERLRRQRTDPRSKCAIRCLSPESQATRLEAKEKIKKRRLDPSIDET